MKLREFWIDTHLLKTALSTKEHYTAFDEDIDEDMLLVREVSPKLDAAYAECERALEIIIDVPTEALSWSVSLAQKALAELKKARGK